MALFDSAYLIFWEFFNAQSNYHSNTDEAQDIFPARTPIGPPISVSILIVQQLKAEKNNFGTQLEITC